MVHVDHSAIVSQAQIGWVMFITKSHRFVCPRRGKRAGTTLLRPEESPLSRLCTGPSDGHCVSTWFQDLQSPMEARSARSHAEREEDGAPTKPQKAPSLQPERARMSSVHRRPPSTHVHAAGLRNSSPRHPAAASRRFPLYEERGRQEKDGSGNVSPCRSLHSAWKQWVAQNSSFEYLKSRIWQLRH